MRPLQLAEVRSPASGRSATTFPPPTISRWSTGTMERSVARASMECRPSGSASSSPSRRPPRVKESRGPLVAKLRPAFRAARNLAWSRRGGVGGAAAGGEQRVGGRAAQRAGPRGAGGDVGAGHGEGAGGGALAGRGGEGWAARDALLLVDAQALHANRKSTGPNPRHTP